MTTRAQIDREAEEAEQELTKIGEQEAEAERERLAREKEPLVHKNLEDIFQDEEQPPDQQKPEEKGVEVKPPEEKPTADSAEIARLTEELRRADDRFRTLQGMHNKEGFTRLEEKIAELEKKLAEKTATAKPEETETDAELLENVGEKAAKIITQLQKQNASLEKTLNDLTGQAKVTGEKTGLIENALAQTAEERFWTGLSPEARALITKVDVSGNLNDAGFLAFLREESEDSPYQRLSFYNPAVDSRDFKAINKIVAAYTKRTAKPPEEKKEEIDPQTPTEATPTGRGAPPPKSKTDKRTFTQKQVDEFDRLYMAGKLKGDPAKIEQMWNEIQDAIAEGRVR